MQTIVRGSDIEIVADFDQSASPITYRVSGADEWMPTPYQVADAAHSAENALRLVSEWADQQS